MTKDQIDAATDELNQQAADYLKENRGELARLRGPLEAVARLYNDPMLTARICHDELVDILATEVKDCGSADLDIAVIVNGLKDLVEHSTRWAYEHRSWKQFGPAVEVAK